MEKKNIDTIIFDLGNVLIDWNPLYLYKNLFEQEEEMNYFFQNICTSDWNEEQDAGRTLKEGTELLVSQFPDHKTYIEAYYGRWEEMLKGEIRESVEILTKIKSSSKYKLYALTNWSDETFSIAWKRFEFLHWFEGIVVSGREKTRKPFPLIYKILLERYSIQPERALFIDDNLRNIMAAKDFGIQTIHFISPQQLKEELVEFGVSV
ncbi:MAG TPA: HAD family phosphatase [Cytophagales bacterium]|nr:HAD family phosphatase [Cytophagales bacterium]